jgi:uncharacterized protein YceK
MSKILWAVAVMIVVSGCSHIKITAAMCNQIAQDPNAQIPQECRDYSEKAAAKAFDKVVDEKKVSKKDIEFSREK